MRAARPRAVVRRGAGGKARGCWVRCCAAEEGWGAGQAGPGRRGFGAALAWAGRSPAYERLADRAAPAACSRRFLSTPHSPRRADDAPRRHRPAAGRFHDAHPRSKHPVLLAGMNVAAGPKLAAAVTNAGGMGVIGGVGYTPEQLQQNIDDLKAQLEDKNAPFGVDLLLPKVGAGARATNYDCACARRASGRRRARRSGRRAALRAPTIVAPSDNPYRAPPEPLHSPIVCPPIVCPHPCSLCEPLQTPRGRSTTSLT